MSETKINNSGVAVDQDYFWRPMSTCPMGAKVQLLNSGGVAIYGSVGSKDIVAANYRGWAPLPKKPEWMT